jgi:hypothetical protein
MTTGPTSPAIFAAQNTDDAKRKVAAQARLYSDAKTTFNVRIAVISIGAVVSATAALLSADAVRTAIGILCGLVLLVFSVVGTDWEKRQRNQAAAVQEDFDTSIFRLPWNSVDAKKRPSGATTTLTDDSRGNLTSATKPLNATQNATTTLAYGDTAHPGDVTGVTDPRSKTSTSTYTASG